MNREEIQSRVEGILKKIAPEADLAQVPATAPLRETLDIDSFDYLRFITELHGNFVVEIPESDYPKLMHLSGVVDYLTARCS